MAARKRDYKAEYARRKQRILNAGFKSEREYKRTRTMAREWSRDYSRQGISLFNDTYTPEQTRDYFRAFVEGRSPGLVRHDRHTAEWLHASDPDTYPELDDLEYWSSYFDK